MKDHFADFPVMPGVLLLESLRQAAGRLLEMSDPKGGAVYRLVEAEEVKFGQFVKPGNNIKLFVRLVQDKTFEGRIDLMKDQVSTGKALSARFSLERA